MEFRRALLGVVASLLLVTSCGPGGSEPPSTSLPLQRRGLAIGGDEQTRATDVAEYQITEEEAREIARACGGTVEVADAAHDCPGIIRNRRPGWRPCVRLSLCVKAYNVDGRGVIEIVDQRPSASLCESGPAHVCLRVGLKTSALRNQILGTPASTTSTTTVTTSPSTSTSSTTTNTTVTSTPTTSA
jgi:hypothetical protein